MEQIHIGLCRCGGYGQLFNEQTAKELGRCCDDLATAEKRSVAAYPPQMSEEQIISLEQQEEKSDATVNTPSNT